MITTRFAPSPTGYLHVGNIRVAVLNYFFTRKHGGHFMLRLDDTDTDRSQLHYEEAILKDLKALSLFWDSFARQSDNLARYAESAQKLKDSGFLYPCYETPEELEIKRKNLALKGKPPIYDRSALRLTPKERTALEESGKKPHWRFRLPDTPQSWNDLNHGSITVKPKNLSDPVLIREDGCPLYTFSSVVDDIDYGITHILRGSDHITNTSIQMSIFQALGAKFLPEFGHYPLLTNEEGGPLSKRQGDLSVQILLAEGLLPDAIVTYLASLGTAHTFVSKEEALNLFDATAYGRSSVAFRLSDLQRTNQHMIHSLSYSDLQSYSISSPLTEKQWLCIRNNIETLEEIPSWISIFTEESTYPSAPEHEDILLAASRHPLDISNVSQWITKIIEDTQKQKGQVLKTIRMALTGKKHGPELPQLIACIPLPLIHLRLQIHNKEQ